MRSDEPFGNCSTTRKGKRKTVATLKNRKPVLPKPARLAKAPVLETDAPGKDFLDLQRGVDGPEQQRARTARDSPCDGSRKGIAVSGAGEISKLKPEEEQHGGERRRHPFLTEPWGKARERLPFFFNNSSGHAWAAQQSEKAKRRPRKRSAFCPQPSPTLRGAGVPASIRCRIIAARPPARVRPS